MQTMTEHLLRALVRGAVKTLMKYPWTDDGYDGYDGAPAFSACHSLVCWIDLILPKPF
jgi:hypothetical protein